MQEVLEAQVCHLDTITMPMELEDNSSSNNWVCKDLEEDKLTCGWFNKVRQPMIEK